MTSNPYTPDEVELIGCYAGAMEEQAGENYATAKADAERGIAKIKADAALTAVEKVLELHEPEEYEDPAGTFFCRTCGDWNMCEDPMGEQPDYPCPTVRAIEGAINE